MTSARQLILLAATWLLGSCAQPAQATRPLSPCVSGDSAMVRDVLYFGRNIPSGGEVSDSAWQQFVDQVVTARFPAGFTVWDAAGQWQGESGQVERERSKVLMLLHPADARSDSLVAETAREYKRRFSQEAVLRERTATCSSL